MCRIMPKNKNPAIFTIKDIQTRLRELHDSASVGRITNLGTMKVVTAEEIRSLVVAIDGMAEAWKYKREKESRKMGGDLANYIRLSAILGEEKK